MTYDAEVDILYIRLQESPVYESDEVEEGVVYDYDLAGRVVGMEIQKASEHLAALKPMPRSLPPGQTSNEGKE